MHSNSPSIDAYRHCIFLECKNVVKDKPQGIINESGKIVSCGTQEKAQKDVSCISSLSHSELP